MSRLGPWRNKPPQHFQQIVPRAKELRLYLVSETGPTSFIFKDEQECKYKVSIGYNLSCSCGQSVGDHCPHTLYVLLKKYRVDEKNPIFWQASYLDSELEGLVQMKYSERKKSEPTITRKKFKKKHSENKKTDDAGFPIVDDEDSCPICYEALKQECYSQCSGCGNCLHSKCLKVWSLHKMDTGDAATCPMCRHKFQNPLLQVIKDIERWKVRTLIHAGLKCSACNKVGIIGRAFQCVICPNLKLCQDCFDMNQHEKHRKYMVKETPKDDWVPAVEREWVIVKPQKAEEKQYRDLSVPLALWLARAYPTQKELDSQKFKHIDALNIVGNQMKMRSRLMCQDCHSAGGDDLRRLPCGHLVHDRCLAKCVETGKYECPTDYSILLQGYLQLMQIKIEDRSSLKEVHENVNSSLKDRARSKPMPIKHKPNSSARQLSVESFPMIQQPLQSLSKLEKPQRVFRIKKTTHEKKLELPVSLQITGVQQAQNVGIRGIFRQGNIF